MIHIHLSCSVIYSTTEFIQIFRFFHALRFLFSAAFPVNYFFRFRALDYSWQLVTEPISYNARRAVYRVCFYVFLIGHALCCVCIRSAARFQASCRRLRRARSVSSPRLSDVGQPSRHERRLVQGRPSRRSARAQALRQRRRRRRRSSADDRPWRVPAVSVGVDTGRGTVQLYAILTAGRRPGVTTCPPSRTRCNTH